MPGLRMPCYFLLEFRTFSRLRRILSAKARGALVEAYGEEFRPGRLIISDLLHRVWEMQSAAARMPADPSDFLAE